MTSMDHDQWCKGFDDYLDPNIDPVLDLDDESIANVSYNAGFFGGVSYRIAMATGYDLRFSGPDEELV